MAVMDWYDFKWTTTGSWNLWYPVDGRGGTAAGLFGGTPLSGTINLQPFYSGRSATITRAIAAKTASTSGTTLIRAALYAAKSRTDLFPASLVVDCGSFAIGATLLQTTSLNVSLLPDYVYWRAYWSDLVSGGHINMISAPIQWPLFGNVGSLAYGFIDHATAECTDPLWPGSCPMTNWRFLTNISSWQANVFLDLI